MVTESSIEQLIEVLSLNPNDVTSFNDLAIWHQKKGNYAQAAPLYQQALAIWEKALGLKHPVVTEFLNNLASLYQTGPEHPNVAGILNNLANLYQAQGNYTQAEPLYQRALAIREKALGTEHPDVAGSLNNLASLYQAQGNYAQAESLYQRALAIQEKALWPEHPAVAASLNNLAGLYQAQGNYAQATPLHQRALAIQEKALGPAHPDVATSLNNLASLYLTQGNYTQAEPLYQRALAIQEKALGPEHPDVAASLNNLALLYTAQGNYNQAEPLHQRALAIREKALGPEHPDVARSLNNLAILYKEQGNYAQAEPLHQRALAIQEKALWPEHPAVAKSLNGLAVLYLKQGNYAQAAPLYQRALAIGEKALGPEHPDVAKSLNNLANLYEAQGKYALAAPLYERAQAIFKKLSQDQYPTTGITPALYWQEQSMQSERNLANLKQQKAEEDKRKAIEAKNQELELQIEETKKAYKIAHEKEKEMLSFFTHTMRNALATAPESLRQAIRLLGSEDYEKNKKQYKAINKIAALFSTLSLTDCLIDTFKQSINNPQEFKLSWQNDNTGDATPKWVIASALRQSLNRIIFMSDTSQLEKLLNVTATASIVSTRKSFIESVLPLNVDHQGINTFYDWLNSINTIEISIKETNHSNFGVNQVKFSLLFATTSELILNALKYWDGTGNIQISWQLIDENYIFTVKNPCHENASSNLAGTHKGIAFIKRLMVLLGEQAQFNCSVEEQLFVAELQLHQSLFGA